MVYLKCGMTYDAVKYSRVERGLNEDIRDTVEPLHHLSEMTTSLEPESRSPGEIVRVRWKADSQADRQTDMQPGKQTTRRAVSQRGRTAWK